MSTVGDPPCRIGANDAIGNPSFASDWLVEVPVQPTIAAPGDGATLNRQSLFDDGPNKPVRITPVSLGDPAAGTATAASFRAGRSPELSTDAVMVPAYRDSAHGTLISAGAGEADDAAADIRVTETRDGDSVFEIREVRPARAGQDAWRFRNQTRLTRIGD